MEHEEERLVPNYEKMNVWQEENGGVFVNKLDAGTHLEVTTQNNVYHLTIIDPKDMKLRIRGGRWKQPIEILFNGSTWGGSMLKIGWVGYGMRMEFSHPEKPAYVIRTSFVVDAKITGDDWEYEMCWPDEIRRSKATSVLPDA